MTLPLRLWPLFSLILFVLVLSTHSFAADDGITDISIISIPASSAGLSVSHELSFVATRELTSAQVKVDYPDDFHVFRAKLPPLSYQSGQSLVFSVQRVISAGERVVLRADDIVNPTTPKDYFLHVFTGAGPGRVTVPLAIQGADGAVTVAWVDPDNLLPRGTSSHTLNFTATSGLAAGGTIAVQYPSGFNLSGATLPPNQDFTLQEVSGQTIIYRVSRSYLPGEFVAVRADGIVNPISYGTHFLKISTSSDPTVVSIPYLIRAGGTVNSFYLQTSATTTGQTASYTLNFDPTTGLPEGSTVSLEFPEGFTPAVETSPTNQYTVENVSGQSVTLRMLKGVKAYVYHQPTRVPIRPEPGEVVIPMGVVNPSVAGAYYFKLWTSNDPGKAVFRVNITNPLLSISFAGSGRGSVNGSDSCQSPGMCSFTTTEPRVTLIPTPEADSVFAGWSGACDLSNDNCEVVMDSSKTVTAIFNLADKVRILGRPYSTLAAAFAEAASGTVEARATGFPENLMVTRPTRFKGGFDNQFTSNRGGFTVLNGTLTVGAGGSLVAESLVIR